MPTLITSAGTVSTATGRGPQGRLFYADSKWWLFYMDSTNTNQLKVKYAATLTGTWNDPTNPTLTWGATPVAGAVANSGVNFTVAYKSIGGVHVFHITFTAMVSNTSKQSRHVRCTVSGTTVTWGTEHQVGVTMASSDTYTDDGPGIGIASDDLVHYGTGIGYSNSSYANPAAFKSSQENTTASGHWNSGVEFETVSQYCKSRAMFPQASGNMLTVQDSGSGANDWTNLRWKRQATWSTGGMANVFASNLSAQNKNDWGGVRVSDTDVHVVARSGASAFTHRRFNGTSWSNGASLPTQAIKAGSGLFMATDGTDVWLFVIDSAAGNAVKYCKWTAAAGTWDASWTSLVTSSATRNFISGHCLVSDSRIGILYTQPNGSNFDIYTEELSFGGGGVTVTGTCRIEGKGETSPGAGTRYATGQTRIEASGQERVAGTAYRAASVRLEGIGEPRATGMRYAGGTARLESRTDASGVGSALKVGSVRIEGRGEPRISQGLRYASGLVRLEGRGVLQPLSGTAYLTGLARIEGGGFIRISPAGITVSGTVRIEGRSDPGASGTRLRTGLVQIQSGSLLRALGINIAPPVPALISGRGEIRVIGRAYRTGLVRIEGRGRLTLTIPDWEEEENLNVYELLVPMPFGELHAGKVNLWRARFLTYNMTVRTDLPGVNPVTGWLQNVVGPPAVTYFYERGTVGSYFFYYPSYPSGELVGVELDDGTGTIPSVFSVNPALIPTRATGARTVIRTVKNSATESPILNALLTLKGPTGIILDRNYTDSVTGEIRWALDDNIAGQNYTVSITAPGFSPVVDEPLTVAGNSLSGDLLMNPIVPTPVAGIEFCSIDGQLIDGFGEPVEGMAVTAEPDPMPMWTDTALIGGEKRQALSLPDGTFNLQLIRGKSYRIVVPLWGVDETLPVPDVANTTLKAMLESVGITSQEIPASS